MQEQNEIKKEYIRVQICYGERKERLEAEKILNKKIGGKERNGYLLEYNDGFRTWMPESRFIKTFRTVDLKMHRTNHFAICRDCFYHFFQIAV